MTPLRQRMTEDMQLRGLAPATQQAYLRYAEPDVRRCPSCGQPMQLVQTLSAKRQQERPVAMVGEPSSRGPPQGLERAQSVAS
jgi:hypothetical protein